MIEIQGFGTQEELACISYVTEDYLKNLSRTLDKSFIAGYGCRFWDFGMMVFHGDFKESDVVLDVGGACSFIMAYLSKFFKKGYIVDAANEGIPEWYDDWFEMVMQFDVFKNGKIEVIAQNAKSLPFDDKYFDKVITFSAFEHFEESDDTLCCKEIHRVLKDDGLFLGTVDFNPITEMPRPVTHPTARAYTYESFFRRIVNPAPFKLYGESRWTEKLVPEKVNYAAIALFFKMVKK